LALASILFPKCLSWFFQVWEGSRISLAFGAYSAATGRTAGRTASGAATAGRAAGAAVAAAIAFAVVTVVTRTGVLAVLVALAVGFRDEVMAPIKEGPVTLVAAGAAVTVVFTSESRSSKQRKSKEGGAQESI
jgi:hypothetical protein